LIVRDAAGSPTGIFKDAAMGYISKAVPEDSLEQELAYVQAASDYAASFGVTSVQDMSAGTNVGVYQEMVRQGRLKTRIYGCSPLADYSRWKNAGLHFSFGGPMLRVGCLKGYADGSLGSTTAWFFEPYMDAPTTSGIPRAEVSTTMKQNMVDADKAGLQVTVHAIGDRANRVALDAFESAAKANGPRDRRDRIEHAQVVAPAEFSRFARLSVIASMQPSHQTTDMRWAEQRVGPARTKGAYAWATMQKYGVRLAFGTDYDVEPISPFRGLYACVTRELPDGGPQGGWEPQEKISLGDCIRAYTTGSAYAEFMEGKKGELKEGEFADFIVLSNDLTKVTPREYVATKVLRTVVGGETVYLATPASAN